jgi:hypothetical protein
MLQALASWLSPDDIIAAALQSRSTRIAESCCGLVVFPYFINSQTPSVEYQRPEAYCGLLYSGIPGVGIKSAGKFPVWHIPQCISD